MFDYLRSIWCNKPAAIRKQARPKRRLLPQLEYLEDRCLPTIAIAEFPVLTAGSSPFGITTGPDGNIWFTENQADKIGMINPATHAVSEFLIPTATSGPLGITAGPDGNIWFTENAANQIGEINPTTHAISEFSIPTANSGPVAITAGPDGNIWFTEFAANQIGEINPATDIISEFPIPTSGSGPEGITAGPDDNVWFTESNGNNIGTINPTQHTFAEYAVPQGGSLPYEITSGPNGNLWFVENSGNQIGEINPTTQAFNTFAIPTGSSGPFGIAAGPDGNIWFAETSANQIGEVNLATGVVAETPLPTSGASPSGITAGPGGTLWFTELSGNQIGEVIETPTITTSPSNQTAVEGQTATFSAAAVGFPTPTVQWQVSTNGGASFTPLTNGGIYGGATTDTLTITGVTTAMNGYEYEAIFTNGVSPTPSATAGPAVLTVKPVLSITPTLLQGIVGVNYNQTLTVLGSTTPFNLFSVTNFSPGTTGLTASDIASNPINGTFVINGTPTAAGTATFTVNVANTAGNTLTQNMTITINPPLSIATSSLPPGTAGFNYKQNISVIGGISPYTTFSVTNFNSGTTGLNAGAITALPTAGTFTVNGTASAGGTVAFTVNVTDSAGTAVTQNFTITFNPPLGITPSLPAGTAGAAYDQTLAVTGGGTPYATFTVTNLNAGTTGLTLGNLTVDPVAATITVNGTPIAAGTTTFTVNVVDAVGASLTRVFSLKINPPMTITPSLPQGTVGANYHRIISISGGSTPYATVTVTGFSDGGTGLTAGDIAINSSTGTIVVNGTPTAVGTATFTVNVTDAAGSSLTQPFSITINPAPTMSNMTTTQWTVGLAGFSGTSTISGGTGPFSIAAATGLPPGLTAVLNGNIISFTGTPTTAGAYPASITIHDAAGAAVSEALGITIDPAPTIGNLTVTQWTAGMGGFTGALNVAGGTGGLAITGSSGLPTGLKIGLAGNSLSFTGTPTATGTFTGSVTLQDTLGAHVTKTFTITINAPPTIGNLTVTQWTAGKSGFTGTMTITAGTEPFVIAASGLPTGLTAFVSGNVIRFTGTPTTAQTFAGSISLDDAAGAAVSKSFSITINPPLQITTTSFPPLNMGVLYSIPLKTQGGTGAITFAISAGSLPPGMKLSSTGVISGVSRGIGTFTFTITATDAVGSIFVQKLSLSLRI